MLSKLKNFSVADREIIDRLRKNVGQSQQRGVDVSHILHKIAGSGDKISQDELLIAMSRISDSVSLGDVKDLHRLLAGAQAGANAGLEDIKVSIAEAVQILLN